MNRQQRRAHERKSKKSQAKSQKRIKGVEQAISRMPAKCDECGLPFDKTNHSELDRWRIAVYDDGGINLVCPGCVPEDVASQERKKSV